MTQLTWDKVGSRRYETGVDRGVLYPMFDDGVAWNGLTSVDEKRSGGTTTPYYLDGVKYYDDPALGDYSATLHAITYPDEFLMYDGVADLDSGMSLESQQTAIFGLSYRTKIGTDQDSDAGYKIHLLYNLTAVPTDKSYGTLNTSANLSTFNWEITGVPEPIPGFRPTVHAVLDSTKIEPRLMAELELILYGKDGQSPRLPPLAEFVDRIMNWGLVVIKVNDDGTWTASGYKDHIRLTSATSFEIRGVNGSYLNPDTYEITTTAHSPNNFITDGPTDIDFEYNTDGSWTASAISAYISIDDDGVFSIHSVRGTNRDADTYDISTTYSTDT